MKNCNLEMDKVNKITVGIGEIGFGQNSETLITHSLGSCIGVAMYDPRGRIGVMGHIRLYSSIFYTREHSDPESKMPQELEGCYADTAIPKMIQLLVRKGGLKQRLVVKLAGGGFMFKNCSLKDAERDNMDVGKKNLDATRLALKKENVTILAEEVGGDIPRTMILEIQTGKVLIRTAGMEDRIL